MTRYMRTVLATLAFPLMLTAPAIKANLMPIGGDNRQVESDHFVYIYQQALESQVPALMKDCEDAYRILTPIFRWAPKEKTLILFQDAWDEHNGMAGVSPRPTIMLIAADTTPPSSIYHPGNFLRRTVFHEFTHILAMDAQYGADAVIAAVFGRIMPVGDPLSILLTFCAAPPGELAPDWYLEGLSVWAETEFTGPGRGRNSFADMIMRMPVADNRLLPAEQWNLRLPEWPYGEAAYLYGMRTIQYAQARYGTNRSERNVAGELADSVSHSFMFSFDHRARPVTGEDFAGLTRGALLQESRRQATRIAKLKEIPPTPLIPLTPERLQVAWPVFSADGRAVFFTANGEAERDTLYRYHLDTARLEKLDGARVQSGISRLAAAPDRNHLYYTRLNIVGRDRIWSELREYNVRKNRSRVVSRLSRYRFPAISPDGRRLAAVRNERGTSSLVVVALPDAGKVEREKELATASGDAALIDPVFGPDGKTIFYVRAGRDGSQLRAVDPESGRDEPILDWPCIILSPTLHPSGKELVFSADRNGVYNLYRMPLDPIAAPTPITHVIGGAFTPSFSPDGRKLALSTYDSYGFHLAVLDYNPPPLQGPLPTLEPVWPGMASNEKLAKKLESEPLPALPPSRPYRSAGELRFDYWTPWLTASENGVQGGLAAQFSDPAGYQILLALGGGDSDAGMPVGSIVYQYSGLYPLFTLYGNYQPDSYLDLVQDTDGIFYDYAEKVGVAGAMITLPWERVDRLVTLSAGYQFTDRRVIDDEADDYAGRDLLTTNLFEGGEGALFGKLEFFNGTFFGRSHSVEQGRLVSVGGEWSNESLGGDLERTRFLGEWNEYVPLPWSENHVLKLQGLYGTGSGDEIAQGAFGLGGYGTLQSATTPGLPRNILLRGYDDNTQVGQDVAKAGVAYRFPILRLYEGMSPTIPIYLQQVFGEFYYEGGKAWSGASDTGEENKWLNAAGAELNFSMTLLRFIDIAPGLGVVYAFDREDRRRSDDGNIEDVPDDKLQVYLSIKAAVNF